MNQGSQAFLELSDLGKSFGNKQVLKQMDLTVEKGEFVAVVGKSGCGKSTLLRILAGLEKPTDGEVRLDGETVKGQNKKVKIMFQDGRLLPWKKVKDNVALGLKKEEEKKEALQMLHQVGLSDRADEWPAVLSGGQKQRVALARALVHHPELLLLDEPLGALDALTRLEMHELIRNLWEEKEFTAVLVTHDVEEAVALATRVILIDDGEIALNQTIKMPFPRKKDNPIFAKTVTNILNHIMGRNSELKLTR
ncbi:sulfonate transport system ATP-binding protein [Fictibacillus solisalsi]|uniref:Sulfonate transport system ATP-binding protein n=1 Tax=Fictibacillus solisalsi TaxID=459525 RepID=A0A1G9X865_9BACL|nr:ATP-binding cassette domain-containing protein [Fictibacillus solisalsi]SDM92666.1 sulfonate transport system ATP-binding protein [Fictibacillus solisalsi]